MKPLTIEQLKSLEVGDWAWISRLNNKRMSGYVTNIKFTDKMFTCQSINRVPTTARIADYGKTWVAYHNKQESECKGEIVELPCLRDKPTLFYHGEPILRKELNYMTDDGTICSVSYSEDEFAEAEHRLAELKGEVNGGKEKYV